ncbi:CRISPR-associated protein Cas4 [Siphonobacter sp. BAB-5385]|uniref:CRISPR-associated protein Cas4 n=1 Tax=Siphonobacter sp. BAB-5385 TaxID=1864822 RepID=UPI000B9ED15B|nr:CRISPR-associated protein Cas4 [Siphonobacter sp. BAB-5385]OZI05904.1 CRISPR-associated protein Cas4 [Siphonobacter sp. BAB-5385]
MSYPNATLINYYHLCHRKMWLHANHIRMEHTSEAVAEGKQLHEHAYPQRAERYREITLDGSKIDFYDPYNKVVHEIKKSDKLEHSHVAQVQFYLYLLQKNGVAGATGLIEYPKLRQTQTVYLEETDLSVVESWIQDIERIINSEQCPGRISKSRCQACSYFDFCYAEEVE